MKNCPKCRTIFFSNIQELGKHLALQHNLSYSALIIAGFVWAGEDQQSFQYAQLILADMDNMTKVCKNLRDANQSCTEVPEWRDAPRQVPQEASTRATELLKKLKEKAAEKAKSKVIPGGSEAQN